MLNFTKYLYKINRTESIDDKKELCTQAVNATNKIVDTDNIMDSGNDDIRSKLLGGKTDNISGDMNNNDITVSVVMLTYNHKKYIRKALDGIIMQKTSFRYEVIVCDDCSDDGTQEVLKEYQLRYPDTFRLVLREE